MPNRKNTHNTLFLNMKYLKIFFTVFILYLFVACNIKSAKQENISDLIFKEKYSNQKLNDAIEQIFTSDLFSVKDSSVFPVHAIYAANKYQSFWLDSLSRNPRVDTLFSYLFDIEKHGLQSGQLGIDTLFRFYKEMNGETIDYYGIARLDIGLSNLYLKYCSGLTYGFINLADTLENHNIKLQQPDSAFISNCFSKIQDSLSYFLRKIQPKSATYLALIDEREKLKILADSVFDSIPNLTGKETIKFGAIHPIIPLIARRLMISGEIPFDSAYNKNYVAFDEKLLIGLDVFRKKTGLLIDKEIGNQTINALNIPFPDYIEKINANLERLRWKHLNPENEKHIHVNVADMTLEAFRADTVTLRMKVCVGKPPKNKTPILQSKIYELKLNPTWTVPNSIIVKEISKIALVDTNYFDRLNIRIFRKGMEVNPNDVPWNLLSKKYQPYILVQDSGAINALGRIKFNFHNKYSVYLHDTNLKSAFNRHNRALSHGCVRVEKPLALAYFCLPEIKDINNKKQIEKSDILKDKIRYSIGYKPKSKTGKDSLRNNVRSLKLEKVWINPPIPIIIEYKTCYLNEQGWVQFRNDIYNLDNELIKLLKEYK